jgi:hypothetical protein
MQKVKPDNSVNLIIKTTKIIGLLVVLLIGGFFALLYESVNYQPKPYRSNSSNYFTPESYISPHPINEEWQYRTSKYCEVNVPIPPNKEPFAIPYNWRTFIFAEHDKGGAWEFEDEVYKHSDDKFFKWTAIAAFKGGSSLTSIAYDPGFVEIDCGPNTNNYTTKSYYEARNKSGEYYLKNIRVGTVTLWNREVIEESSADAETNINASYFFATPHYVYRVRKFSLSPLKIIHDTTEEIFNNLQFP